MASNSLLFTRNANNGALTTERIRQLAPAVFSTTHAENLTSRYVPMHTSELLPVLADYGYEPVQAAQKRSRKQSSEHAGHMLAFAKRDDIFTDSTSYRPEIIVYNSHDGSGAVKLFAGLYRFICSNGIVAGEGYNVRVLHSRSITGFETMLRSIVDSLPSMLDNIQRLHDTKLTLDQAYTMAERSVQTRWDYLPRMSEQRIDPDNKLSGIYATERTVSDVLRVTRNEDNYADAFTVFNRIQEGVIRGNAFVKSFTEKNPDGTLRKARSLGSIKEHVRINSELWDIANEVAFA